MTEQEFYEALSEFTSKPSGELTMSDSLEDLGVDSIGIFEFSMKVEDAAGGTPQLDASVLTVQDLFDRVLDAAGVSA